MWRKSNLSRVIFHTAAAFHAVWGFCCLYSAEALKITGIFDIGEICGTEWSIIFAFLCAGNAVAVLWFSPVPPRQCAILAPIAFVPVFIFIQSPAHIRASLLFLGASTISLMPERVGLRGQAALVGFFFQQLIMLMSGVTELRCIIGGAYADGTVVPRIHLIGDQNIYILVSLAHSYTLIRSAFTPTEFLFDGYRTDSHDDGGAAGSPNERRCVYLADSAKQ